MNASGARRAFAIVSENVFAWNNWLSADESAERRKNASAMIVVFFRANLIYLVHSYFVLS